VDVNADWSRVPSSQIGFHDLKDKDGDGGCHPAIDEDEDKMRVKNQGGNDPDLSQCVLCESVPGSIDVKTNGSLAVGQNELLKV